VSVLLPVGLGLAVSLVHFFGEELDEYTSKYNLFFVAFSAGFTLAYFFTVLLPETISQSLLGINNLPVLAGISLFYLLEEALYEKEGNLGKIKYEFKEIHSIFISLYHLTIGMIFYLLSKTSNEQLTLFFLPVLIHTAVNSISTKEMHEEMIKNTYIKMAVSSSTLIGVILAAVVQPSQQILYTLLGILGGSFLYIVIHDALNPHRERPIGFITGLTTFLTIIYTLL